MIHRSHMLVKLNAHWPQDLENKEAEFHHIRGLKHIHTDSPSHTIMLENTKILSMEHNLFERGVKEAIYIRALKPSLNRDGGWHNLPPVWNNIIKERLTVNGAGTTTGGWGGDPVWGILLLFPFVSTVLKFHHTDKGCSCSWKLY